MNDHLARLRFDGLDVHTHVDGAVASAAGEDPRAYLHFVTKLIVKGWPQKDLRNLLPDRIIANHPELLAGHHPPALPP